jgi:hypothetical protein
MSVHSCPTLAPSASVGALIPVARSQRRHAHTHRSQPSLATKIGALIPISHSPVQCRRAHARRSQPSLATNIGALIPLARSSHRCQRAHNHCWQPSLTARSNVSALMPVALSRRSPSTSVRTLRLLAAQHSSLQWYNSMLLVQAPSQRGTESDGQAGLH